MKFEFDNRAIYQVMRGISDIDKSHQGVIGIENLTSAIQELEFELLKNENSEILKYCEDHLKELKYILIKLRNWHNKGALFGNKNANIFFIALKAESETLVTTLEAFDFVFKTKTQITNAI